MAKCVIKKAKTIEEAVQAGLEDLGLDIENVKVEILNFDGSAEDSDLKAVKITEHISDDTKIRDFVKLVSDFIGADVTIDIAESEDDTIDVNLSGENVNNLIGKKGETLYAISYLTNVIVNKGRDNYKRVVVDCEDYRSKREQKLINLANESADRVCKYHRSIQLPPMPAAERRIIHTALQNNKMVETESFGNDPQRCVVIRMKPYTKVI